MFPSAPGTQTIRFRRPTPDGSASAAADASEKLKTGAGTRLIKDTLIREQLNRTNPPWAPKLSVAFRLLVLIRFCAAMYTSISDCDETFNYWEPTHYLIHGKGFQTWEYSPEYSIRSWFYILLHSFPAWATSKIFPLDKRPEFFSIRIMLALYSAYCESKLYRAIADHINIRAARYYLGMAMFSAGLWSASSAYLPSSFAWQTITFAYSYALEPVTSRKQSGWRTFYATFFFVLATVVGWPFVGILALPFIFEELSLYGDDEVMPASRPTWAAARFNRLFVCGVASLTSVTLPMLIVDRMAYGKWVFVPLKIVMYNVFPDQKGAGPELYGTEPVYFYVLNLLLNFNIVFVLAMLSIPLLLVTKSFSKSQGLRLGNKIRLVHQTSSTNLLIVRLLPVYIWLAIMSQQPHKEERFMHPIYSLICFNAAVTLSLARGWMEDIFVKITSSPYRAGRSMIFSTFTRFVIITAGLISVSRIIALQYYYHAPLDLMFHLQYNELAIRAIQTHPDDYKYLNLNTSKPILEALNEAEHAMDLGPLKSDNLSLCLGKDWYRFPAQFLVPEQVEVNFVKSDFKGILPTKFIERENARFRRKSLTDSIWKRTGTRKDGGKFNSINREEADRYVDLKQCEYFITSHYPKRETREQEIKEAEWDVKKCVKIMDQVLTKQIIFRTIWLPFEWWNDSNEVNGGQQTFGELCLYQQKKE